MRTTRVLRAVALAAAGALVAVTQSPLPAGAILGAVAAPGEETAFAAAINRLRSDRGLPPLRLDGELNAIARSWSLSMAAAGDISHRSDLRSGVTSDWLALGENVGVGPTVDNLMTAFVNSPGHLKNLVDARFTHIGIGAVIAGGLIFTAHEFMQLDGQGSVAPVPAAPRVTPPTTVRFQPSAPRAPATTAAPRRAAPASPVTTVPETPAAPPPPAPTPDRVIDVIDRLRGNPPAF